MPERFNLNFILNWAYFEWKWALFELSLILDKKITFGDSKNYHKNGVIWLVENE